MTCHWCLWLITLSTSFSFNFTRSWRSWMTMAPLRRYLRITKYSVLECRIYLDNPALTQSWLLNPRDPILPKVIESVRPLVLPKLREEQERDRMKKRSKKRTIKDVVAQDDFEVSIFLTETDTRHSLLHKKKHFRDKVQTKLTSNSSRLTGGAHDAPIDVHGDETLHEAAGGFDDGVPLIRQEEDDQNAINLDDIPAIDETTTYSAPANRRPKRRRQTSGELEGAANPSEVDPDVIETIDTDSSDDQLFVGDGDDDDDSGTAVGRPPPSKRRREKAAAQDIDGSDDKKKLGMDISYEGFAIYGRVLCLVVKRREGVGKGGGLAMPTSGKSQAAGRPRGQAIMENWISSTQLPDEVGGGDEEAFLAS